jgi:L-arabinose isomerase
MVLVDADTDLRRLEQELFWNDAAYRLSAR